MRKIFFVFLALAAFLCGETVSLSCSNDWVKCSLGYKWLPSANLSGVTSICHDFSEAYLWGADLGRGNFKEANFFKADLRNIGAWQTILAYANFTEADLNEAQAEEANFTGAKFIRTDMSGGNFRGANFKDAVFEDAIVEGANFAGARGLTNEQKQYLVQHGAVNVPAVFEYDLEDDGKIGTEVVAKKTFFKSLASTWKWCFRSRNK